MPWRFGVESVDSSLESARKYGFSGSHVIYLAVRLGLFRRQEARDSLSRRTCLDIMADDKGVASGVDRIEHIEDPHDASAKHGDRALALIGDDRVEVTEEDVRLRQSQS